MPLFPGAHLGPYEVTGPLGAGGMGEVYRARDPRIGREVAIKVLPAAFASDPDRLRRFEQEVRAAGALNHPNILIIYDVGTHEGVPYIVSELLEGETLRERLGGAGLPQRKAIDYGQQVARGLAAAHEKGIVHRDLKPENLFVITDGRVKILDFGLAKLVQADAASDAATSAPTVAAATEPGAVLGTMGYMSPEQVRGRPADHRADIFSFGAILYELLAGRRAFQGETAADSMSAILTQDPPLLADPGLDRIVRHCLEKSPQERFQSARDLAFHLEAVSGTSAPSGVVAPLARPGLLARRRSVLLAAALVTLPALALWLGYRIAGGAKTQPAVFRQLTFRRGSIFSARFAPDGQTIIYGAAWDGKSTQLFAARPESPESRHLGLPDADLLSISSSGEMAIALGRIPTIGWMTQGTLARAPLAGGAPREVLEKVQDAAWSPDGRLALIRDVDSRNRLEFPAGKILYETAGWISHPRFSPKGDLIAFIDHPVRGDDIGPVAVVDLAGSKRALTPRYSGGAQGLAWHPSGDEIWHTGAEAGINMELRAVTARGVPKIRIVARIPGRLTLQDIFRDGRVLVTHDSIRSSVAGLFLPDSKERDLSWLDNSFGMDLSADGRTALINEEGVGGGAAYAVYVRKTDGSPAVKIGEGSAQEISPDGKWVLSILLTSPQQLVLLPTGAGEPRTLPRETIESYDAATWFPDGKRILFSASEPGHHTRLYAQEVSGGKPRRVTREGFSLPGKHTISPDGRLTAGADADQKRWLCPIDGAEPRPAPGLEAGDWTIRWSDDGRALFVYRVAERPTRIYRVDLASGRKQVLRELALRDPAGSFGAVNWPQVSRDEKTFLYTYMRYLSDLYLVEGLR
ncbi:MAG: protein kinase [Acidobacteria bacterium]|nr:protein kinase [Acidobacteriota bacterium]